MEFIENQNPYLVFIVNVVASFVLSYLLFFAFRVIIKNFFQSTHAKINKNLRYSFYFLTVAASLKATYTLVTLPNPALEINVDKLFNITLILAFTLFIHRFLGFLRDLFYERLDAENGQVLAQRRARTQVEFLFKIAIVIVWLLGISASIMSFEAIRNFGASILASAGIAGILIGFAAQKSISNLLAGMQIAFTQPLKIDDVVVVENEWGVVEEITLTYVVVKIWDSRRMVFPISYFIETPFQNWTRSSTDLVGSVFIYVDYSFPVDEARKALDYIMESDQAQLLWDGRVKKVSVTNLTERTQELRVLISAANASDTFDLRTLVREKMMEYIQRNFPNSLPKHRIEQEM